MQHQARPAKHLPKPAGQRLAERLKLREHEQLLLAGGDRLAELSQPLKLPALGRRVGRHICRGKKLGRMVTDLFEPHRRGQHDPAAADIVAAARFLDRAKLPPEVIHGLLVERRLLPRQAAVGSHLGLGRQVGHDRRVGLEPAEQIGLDQPAERPKALRVGPLPQPFDKPAKLAGRAQ